MKIYDRYQMDFEGKWMSASLIGVGAAIFFLAVYYLGWPGPAGVGAGTIIFSLVLPLLAGIVFIVLARFLRLNAPGIFAILGAVFGLVLFAGSFDYGVLRMIFAILLYLIGITALLACAGGFLPGRLPVSLFFGCAFCIRVLIALLNLSSTVWLREVAALFMLLTLTCLPMAFKSTKRE